MSPSMRLLFVISGLSVGGAEMMLWKLLSLLDPKSFQSEVISLTTLGPVAERIRKLGVPVRALEMKQGWRSLTSLASILKLRRWIERSEPQCVHTWMYHADLVGGVAARLAGSIPVIWSIRNSTLDPLHNKRSTILTRSICARLSGRLPARIVCCSETARNLHERIGYSPEKMLVIPNGFDLSAFKPDGAARQSLRTELGIPSREMLIGMIARFDPQKDHENFIKAAGRISSRRRDARFVLVGEGIDAGNRELLAWIETAGIKDRAYLLGRRDDMPRITAALDVVSLASSYGEAFPNVLGEAMACGVPCVTTDVGDAAFIVGDTGAIVPIGDSEALANAWEKLVGLSPSRRVEVGVAARQRIQDNFELKLVVNRFQNLYRSVASLDGLNNRTTTI